MKKNRKLQAILEAVDSKSLPFPKTLTRKKKINYLSVVNAVALIRSIMKRENRKEELLNLLKDEEMVKKLLHSHTVKECVFFIKSIPNS